MTEELIKLMLSVSGEDAIDDLREQLGYTEASIKQLKDAFQRGELTTDEFLRAAKRLTDQEKTLQENIRLVTDALNKQAVAADNAAESTTANVQSIGKSGESSAFKIMQLGQTLDDLQYVGEMGLRPIINNVMQFDARLGILLIGVQSLINAFGEHLTKAVMGYTTETGAAVDQTERLAKQIEELEKKPHKLAVDYKDLEEAQAKLDKLKADEAAYKAAKESDPEKELAKQAASAVTKYAGGADQLTAIVDAMEKQGGFKHGPAELYARLDKLKYQLENPEFDARTGVAKYDPETTKKNIAEVEAEIERARKQYAKDQVTAFVSGDPAAIAAMQGRVARNPGAFNRQGLDGLTAGEAIRNLPTSLEEMARRLQVDEEIAATDDAEKENKGGFTRARAERLRREAKLKADREAGEREAEALKEKADAQAKQERERTLQKSRADIQRKEAERQAEAVRKAAEADRDRMDPLGAAQRRMTQDARSALRAQDVPGNLADIAAPRLAELVSQGMDVQSATMQSVIEANRQIQLANEALQKNQQMLILMQQQQRRMRTMMPTTQPVPFAN